MSAYYNEHDPFAANWLRELIKAGHIPAGYVDERSIEDVTPDEIKSYTQCHFFAGIGGWPYALRLAGWPDDRPAWTGSAPCQPFSAAGKGGGFADERHLWPAFLWLIGQQRPPVVFGEQVSSKAGRDWFAVVSADLEAHGYAVGAADLCAAGVGAPHIRQRLYFAADAERNFDRCEAEASDNKWEKADRPANRSGGHSGAFVPLANAESKRRQQDTGSQRNVRGQERRQKAVSQSPSDCAKVIPLADASSKRLAGRESQPGDDGPQQPTVKRASGAWADIEYLPCSDGKARPTQSGLFPLAHGVPARVGRLRGYGNAIVPPLAAEFVAAYLEAVE